ncbi:hypothetical protein GCM10010478_05100 [Streptomyces erythrogriseus]|uniref:Uncharacterized protein n=1 Tax=Streptomyces erythrogriseus TaxID=284027 RepID=A0ABN3WAU8_9ACTN
MTLARIGEDAWALADSKRPDAAPLRFTTEELDAAGIDPARFPSAPAPPPSLPSPVAGRTGPLPASGRRPDRCTPAWGVPPR